MSKQAPVVIMTKELSECAEEVARLKFVEKLSSNDPRLIDALKRANAAYDAALTHPTVN